MIRSLFSAILFISVSLAGFAQLSDGFRIEKINKKVRDFKIDSINLSSPLDYYMSREWVLLSGKSRHWVDISTSKFIYPKDSPDEIIDEERKRYILDENIDGIIVYRDSVAAIVTHNDGDGFYLLNYCWIESGRWVNGGQGLADDEDAVLSQLELNLPICHSNIPQIELVKKIPEDVKPFSDFLSGIGQSPEEFLLEQLAAHTLVINGEIHRRKVSWDMLKRLIAMPDFSEKVGHVFMELPSWCQPLMDTFMESDTLDSDIVLQIFREVQPNGWWDKGEFEFICDLWRVNRSLPEGKRFKVVLADYQLPYSKITERHDMKELEDRNTHMADVICNTICSSKDTRGNLFLVGCGHAYKSRQGGIASATYGKESAMTAGAQLVERLGKDKVFTVFQHILSGDNLGNYKAPLRGGVFDRAFEQNGNRPVGFLLAGSPFGNEPFDGIYEIKYNKDIGTYSDNFDGYLFLHALADEPKAEPLAEIFTDDFVDEMKRRASVMGNGNQRWFWFGLTAPELTKQHIIKVLQED